MKKTKRIIAGIVAFACVGVVSVGVAASGFRDIGTDTVEPQTPTYAGMVTEQMTAQGMSLRTVAASEPSAQAESTVTVTATLTASGDTYNDDLAWTIAFKTNSTWASGKNVSDYVTMTVAQDTHSITLDCKQAFGEPIMVTATAVENAKATATCQLDYVKWIEDVEVTTADNIIYFAKDTEFEGQVTWGVGTITPTLDVYDLRVSDFGYWLDDERLEAIAGSEYNSNTTDAMGQYRVDVSDENDGSFSGLISIDLGSFYGAYGVVLSAEQKRQMYNIIVTENLVRFLYFDLLVAVTYNGERYGLVMDSLTFSDPSFYVSYDGITVQTVTEVVLDQSNVAF